VLELAILGLLKEQELHGYELKKRLGETLGPLSSVSFGSLYPALNRLEAAGAVKAVEARDLADTGEAGPANTANQANQAGPDIPMTGSLGAELAAFRGRRATTRSGPREARGSRGKKVYGITERGEALFEELLAAESQSGDDERAFNLKLAFARYLPPHARIGLLERRRAHLVERLARARGTVRTRRERLDNYTRSLMEHSTETTERDISWLDQLIQAERQEGQQ
jgi:DNA-binding PadR family transcriptional regulator